MSDAGATSGRWRRALLSGAALLALGGAAGGAWLAVGHEPADRGIEFERARLRPFGDDWLLDARADIELPREVRDGLDSGVPLDFVVTLDVVEPRRWWPDRRVLERRWHYVLEYYELTRHYRLGAPEEGGSRNFRSLLPALDGLGALRGLEIDAAPDGGAPAGEPSSGPSGGPPHGPLLATLRMHLDGGALPLPLRPFLTSSWRLRGGTRFWSET